ncbi:MULTISPECIES: SDR family NAD(P)-dependent oxidoreductase [Pseudofrankia]|uniref:SDR family NAD(P)-dependent oxidoreductase n=1 Tax=Pseudofrankia TaxID=2994363 RepID=UPI000234CD25|nr:MULTISPECIES: SDR family NAD(P)-dependent oxidoreductase [Pseudofrankia]
MDLGLAGRRAIVTGGSRGIGLAVASALLAEGAQVVIAARDGERLKTAAAQLAAGSVDGVVVPVVADTGSDESVRELVARTVDELGGVDILVNNAARVGGAGGPGGVRGLATADAAADLNVKVLGYLRTAQEVIPHLVAQWWGRIINVGGVAARQVGLVSGSIRNAGIVALTKTLADELGAHGVTVNAVHECASEALTDVHVTRRCSAPEALFHAIGPARARSLPGFLGNFVLNPAQLAAALPGILAAFSFSPRERVQIRGRMDEALADSVPHDLDEVLETLSRRAQWAADRTMGLVSTCQAIM